MLALLLTGAALAALDGGAASHAGRMEGSDVTWHTDVLGEAGDFPLVAPLPPGATVVAASPGVAPRIAAGRIVGFESQYGQWWVDVRQPVEWGDAVLAAPVLDGTGTQRITLDGARFTPADRLGLQPHVGWWAQSGIDHADRRRVERAFGRHRGVDLWVSADPRLKAGLVGDLEPPGASGASVAGAGVAFAGLLALLAAGVKLLQRAVRREKADWYIRHELG